MKPGEQYFIKFASGKMGFVGEAYLGVFAELTEHNVILDDAFHLSGVPVDGTNGRIDRREPQAQIEARYIHDIVPINNRCN